MPTPPSEIVDDDKDIALAMLPLVRLESLPSDVRLVELILLFNVLLVLLLAEELLTALGVLGALLDILGGVEVREPGGVVPGGAKNPAPRGE